MYIVPTGIRQESINNIALDAGALYYASDLAPLDDPTATNPLATVLDPANAAMAGATRGSATFTLELEFRQTEFNGSRGDYDIKQLVRAAPMLSASLLEIDRRNTTKAVAASRAVMQKNGLTRLEFFRNLVAEDYVKNLVFIAQHGQRKLPLVITFKKALNESAFGLEFTDQGEPVINAEFKGIYSLLNDSVVPCSIYMANEAGVILDLSGVSTSSVTIGTPTPVTAQLIWVEDYDKNISVSLANDPHKPSANPFPPGLTIDVASIDGSTQPGTQTINLEAAAGTPAGTYEGFIRYTDNDSILDYEPLTVTVAA
jgi:hypothetical protein